MAIYQEGMDTGQAPFQQTAPAWKDFDQVHLASPMLVAAAADDDAVLEWAGSSPVSARPLYRGVVEERIYISGTARVGLLSTHYYMLYVAATEAAGILPLQTEIFPQNPASLVLQQGC